MGFWLTAWSKLLIEIVGCVVRFAAGFVRFWTRRNRRCQADDGPFSATTATRHATTAFPALRRCSLLPVPLSATFSRPLPRSRCRSSRSRQCVKNSKKCCACENATRATARRRLWRGRTSALLNPIDRSQSKLLIAASFGSMRPRVGELARFEIRTRPLGKAMHVTLFSARISHFGPKFRPDFRLLKNRKIKTDLFFGFCLSKK